MSSNKQYGCPVEVTLEVIGGKWKCVVLWWLRRDAKRFSELMQLIPGMTQKVLTERLRELEADGLVYRQAHRETPPRVEYSLTPRGQTLRPLTELMCSWGQAQLPSFQSGLFRFDRLSILVVANPSPTSKRLYQELAEYRGATLTILPVEATREKLDHLPVDIVIVEFDPLKQDWNQLTRAVQRLKSNAGKPVSTIALISTVEDRAKAFSQGFHVLLNQPFEASELTAAIASLTGYLR
ncbi:helix-turn-helix transcriptional regulator [Oculatella sp. LEGE 06141]|uniref:winged helix-turn-helix transcriptional regulator n=1 Tax=Oculatella sp. LEGE 06141 TaxID=1828648 RepID=UPI0018821A61|nr:helix-turn-helix domain-containing protein [Oculatella sp. LEGE 06141]MBE9178067.1 helix-turn-helix transcriptional regulator [Oculatella sp. LEGE 06141]